MHGVKILRVCNSIVLSYLFNYKYLSTSKVLVRSVVIHAITNSQDGRVDKGWTKDPEVLTCVGSNPTPDNPKFSYLVNKNNHRDNAEELVLHKSVIFGHYT